MSIEETISILNAFRSGRAVMRREKGVEEWEFWPNGLKDPKFHPWIDTLHYEYILADDLVKTLYKPEP